MHEQQRGPGRPILWAFVTAAVAALPVGAVVACVALTRPSGHPQASPRASATGWDKATLWACQAAKDYIDHIGTAGEGQAATHALGWAAESDQGALRDLAARYAATGSDLDEIHRATGATQISTWCLNHKLG